MKFLNNGNKLILSGILNEETDFQSLRKFIEEMKSSVFEVSFGGVERANSCGVIAWFKLLRDLQYRVSYFETPLWLIEQFNMNPFFLKACNVKSFYAPFYDSQNNSHEMILLEFGKDVPVLSDYSNFEIQLSDKYSRSLEPDFEAAEFFQFVTSNFEEFREGAA